MVWIKARFEGRIFQQLYIYFGPMCALQKKLFGESLRQTVFIHEGDSYHFCYKEEDLLRFGKILVEGFLKKGLDSFYKKCISISDSINKLGKQLGTVKLDKLTDKELIDLYNSILTITKNFAAYLMTCEPAETYLNKFLQDKLTKLAPENVDDYYMVLAAPADLSFLQQEKNELIDTKLDKAAIKKHAEKWWFLTNNYSRQTRLKPEFFLKRAKKLKTKISIDNKEKERLLKTLNNRELTNAVRITEKFIYLRDTRKMQLMKWIYHINLVINEFAERLDITQEHAYFLTPEEMITSLEKKSAIPEVSQREYGVEVYKEKGYNIYPEDKSGEWKKKIFGKITEQTNLKGIPSSPGKTKGNVRVLSSSLQAPEFKKGEILATSNTTPDWVVIMEKAAAIITERGGITSHPAIISRELGIPCVTGIKNITEILKTGDTVEVDGKLGVVRKCHTKK